MRLHILRYSEDHRSRSIACPTIFYTVKNPTKTLQNPNFEHLGTGVLNSTSCLRSLHTLTKRRLALCLAMILQGYRKNETINGTRPSAIGKGSPGNIPFFSNILNAKKTPTMMPANEARQKNGPELTSTRVASIE